jgi:hypothetical protein
MGMGRTHLCESFWISYWLAKSDTHSAHTPNVKRGIHALIEEKMADGPTVVQALPWQRRTQLTFNQLRVNFTQPRYGVLFQFARKAYHRVQFLV